MNTRDENQGKLLYEAWQHEMKDIVADADQPWEELRQIERDAWIRLAISVDAT